MLCVMIGICSNKVTPFILKFFGGGGWEVGIFLKLPCSFHTPLSILPPESKGKKDQIMELGNLKDSRTHEEL